MTCTCKLCTESPAIPGPTVTSGYYQSDVDARWHWGVRLSVGVHDDRGHFVEAIVAVSPEEARKYGNAVLAAADRSEAKREAGIVPQKTGEGAERGKAVMS